MMPVTVSTTVAGTAYGYITVLDNTHVFPGAKGWLRMADGSNSVEVEVTDLSGYSLIGLKSHKTNISPPAVPMYGRMDVSAFLANSTLSFDVQNVPYNVATSSGISSSGTGGTNELFVLDPDENTTTLGTEEIVSQFTLNFDGISGSNMTVDFTALGKSAAGTAIAKIRLGGTDGGLDGTVVTSANITSVNYTAMGYVTTIARSTGIQIVKIGLISSAGAVLAGLKDSAIRFTGV